MGDYVLNGEDLRHLILNAHVIKNNVCEKCNGTAYTNWNSETGDDERPGKLSNNVENRLDGECETCDGVGYVDIFTFLTNKIWE